MLFRRTTDWPAWGWTSPFDELDRMRKQMDRIIGGLSRGPFEETTAGVFPLMNVTEDKDNYYVRAELPGIKADELDISVTGDTFSVAGERKLPAKNEDARYHRSERESGKFNRIVTLPRQISTDKVEATSNNGILSVTLPKAEAAKPKQITVKTS